MIDTQKFETAKLNIIGLQRERLGIGTLQEKTVHAVLKDYYAPDKNMQEMPIEGYVADIFTGTEIIEIQTAQFNRMRKKLDAFLPVYPVTIVYPIPRTKWLCWIDEETGECTAKRKSPVTGSIYKAFFELYKIKNYLPNTNLRFCFPLIDMEEYRLLNGWSQDKKRGSSRYDRLPVALVDEILFERTEDYMQLIPYDMEEPFTVPDFAKAVKIKRKEAQTVIHILNYLNIINQCGKKGRCNIYNVTDCTIEK